MFKVGDIVECVDDAFRSDILKGKKYEVSKYFRNCHKIKLKECHPYALFRCSRFKLFEKRKEDFGYKKGLTSQ